jgi:hypothetical protein
MIWHSTIFNYLKVVNFLSQSRLTTLAKNRETWLLPQRPWGRSEDIQGDFQQRHRDMFSQKCGLFHIFFKICICSVSLLNILLISFIFNIKFMFCICFIIIIDLILILDLIHFCLEICKDIWMISKSSFRSPDFLRSHDKATNNSSFAKIIIIIYNTIQRPNWYRKHLFVYF